MDHVLEQVGVASMRATVACLALATASAFIRPAPARAARVAPPRMSIFDLSAARAGETVPLSTYSDKKAILVVNVASA